MGTSLGSSFAAVSVVISIICWYFCSHHRQYATEIHRFHHTTVASSFPLRNSFGLVAWHHVLPRPVSIILLPLFALDSLRKITMIFPARVQRAVINPNENTCLLRWTKLAVVFGSYITDVKTPTIKTCDWKTNHHIIAFRHLQPVRTCRIIILNSSFAVEVYPF